MPTPYPELEIGLHRVQPDGFQVELRFADASSAAERAPVRASCPLEPEALLALELDPEAYGRALSGQVFADPGVIRFLGEVKASVARADLPLRLRLLTDPSAPDLDALRWELLCDPDTGAPYATSERILFSRFMQSPDWRAVRLRPKATLSALVAVAAPRDIGAYGLAEVDLTGEVERARGALGAIPTRVLGQEQPLTLDALADALRSGVDILYLVAHGALDRDRGPVLFLQDAAGKIRRERGDDLARRVGELRDLPRLVVLASCASAAFREGGQRTEPAAAATPGAAPAQSALAPQLAAAGVPAILAMQGRISMETVATLMPRFFQELAADGQIDRALAVARGLVRDRPDAWMPALFLRLRGGRLWGSPDVSSGDDDSAVSLYGRVVVLGERDTDPARPVPAIPVQILGVGETLTNDLGEFRLEHQRFRPGAPVTAEVRHPGHVIYRPYRGRFNLPRPAADRPDEPVELALLPEGSARLLDDYTFKLLAEDMKEEALEQLRPEGSPEEIDFTRYLESLGRALGFSLADVERGLTDWQGRKQADPGTDPYELGLVAVTEKDFARARGLFRRSRLGHESARAALEARMAEMQAQIAEQERLIVRDLDAEANAAALAYDFRAALDLRQQILGYQDRAADPEAWAAAQVAKGDVHQELGIRVGGAEARRHLADAFSAYRAALEVYTRAELPKQWAKVQNDLGSALHYQGTRADGEAGRALLEQAVSAYRAALEVRTRTELPQDWAATQNNLGNALSDQGRRTDGEAGRALLDQAVSAYRAALDVYSRAELPKQWATAQNNLGAALKEQGTRTGGEAGRALLDQAVSAYRAAMEVFTRAELPQDWAMTQNNLGSALQEQGTRTDGEAGRELLEQAVSAYRAALEVRTRADLPQDWAVTQNNLGIALREQGTRTGGEAGRALLEQAVSAYRAALEVFTRAELPQQWAATQNNLGIALKAQGRRTDGEAGRALLEQAVSAYRAALEVRTRTELPQDWAATQNNLGAALWEQSTRTDGEAGRALLEQAVSAYRAALEVFTLEHTAYSWATAQRSLLGTLAELGDAAGMAAVIEELLRADPGSPQLYNAAQSLYHEVVFDFLAAHRLTARWLASHPDDLGVRCNHAETLLTTGQLAEAREALAGLIADHGAGTAQTPGAEPAERLDPGTETALRLLHLAALTGLGDSAATSHARQDLRAFLAGQPGELEIGWSFKGTRHYIGNDPTFAPHRAALLPLLEAAGAGRGALLAALDAGGLDPADAQALDEPNSAPDAETDRRTSRPPGES